MYNDRDVKIIDVRTEEEKIQDIINSFNRKELI
jgi:hypothetical protein